MKYAVIGSRHWPSRELVFAVLDAVKPTAIITGDADGVDAWAIEWAKARGVPYESIAPDYARHPAKIAPLLRNPTIIRGGEATIAFRAHGKSNGTDNAIAHTKQQGKWLLKIQIEKPEPER